MYFLTRDLFDLLRADGLAIPDNAWGYYQESGTPGVIVNPDALTLDDLAAHQAVIERHHHRSDPLTRYQLALHTSHTGLWHPVTTPVGRGEPERPARPDRTSGPARERAATAEAPAPQPAPERPRFRSVTDTRGHEPTSGLRLIRQALNEFAPRLDRPTRLLARRESPAVRGLPTAEDAPAESITVVVGAVPGEGTLRAMRRREVQIRNVVTEQDDCYRVPIIEAAPEGMQALRLNGAIVAVYDRHRFCMLEPFAAVAAYALPAWLEALAAPPAAPSRAEAEATVEAMANAARPVTTGHAEQMTNLRQGSGQSRQRIRDLTTRIAALEAYLPTMPQAVEPDRLSEQVMTLRSDPQAPWLVAQQRGDILFGLRSQIVTDPRDGSPRIFQPSDLRVSLRALVSGQGVFSNDRDSAAAFDRHPRLLGQGFLDSEIDHAIQDCMANHDLLGALELIHAVLTSFAVDDPDVAALDAWNVRGSEDGETERRRRRRWAA